MALSQCARRRDLPDLQRKLKTVWRGALVATVQSFQNMADLPPLADDNLITLVDECHCSQKGSGKSASYAMTLRVKCRTLSASASPAPSSTGR